MAENFRPVALGSPSDFFGKIRFYCRLALDLQVLTVYRSIKKSAMAVSGSILDVGCGASPYKFLFNPDKTQYMGIDIVDADKFDYRNSSIVAFNGKEIPFSDASYDAVLCTEVLEHVQNYQALVDEMHRVMKPGSILMVTVPWSARYHYIPFDFFRYTPSTLQEMFKNFKNVKIISRGTDITSVIAKIMVIWFRNLVPEKGQMNVFSLFISVLCIPLILVLISFAHLSFFLPIGSLEDPLGYTVLAIK